MEEEEKWHNNKKKKSDAYAPPLHCIYKILITYSDSSNNYQRSWLNHLPDESEA